MTNWPTSRPTVKLSTLWLTRQKIGCSPPLFASHTTFSARSSPLSSPDGLPPQASSSIYPTLKRCFPHRFFSIPYTLSTTIISISFSLHLVLLAPINSYELHNYYLVLTFCSCIRVAVCLPMVFLNKTNINTLSTLSCVASHIITSS